MKRVYIVSRYRADNKRDLKFNKLVARLFCREIVKEGNVPVAPHLFYTQFLDDNDEEERECGLGFGIYDLRNSDEYLLVVIDGVISDGMRGEIEEISRLGIPGRIVCMSEREIYEAMKVIQ